MRINIFLAIHTHGCHVYIPKMLINCKPYICWPKEQYKDIIMMVQWKTHMYLCVGTHPISWNLRPKKVVSKEWHQAMEFPLTCSESPSRSRCKFLQGLAIHCSHVFHVSVYLISCPRKIRTCLKYIHNKQHTCHNLYSFL